MNRLLFPVLAAGLCLAQTPQFGTASSSPLSAKERLEKAPPQVENALRARVQAFYQAHIDGKWREADKYVAEDTKDLFFAMQKTRYESCEILNTRYAEGFKKAQVTVTCKGEWQFHNTRQPVVIPMTTTWKVENKEWFWYVENTTGAKATPWGTMTPGPEKSAGAPAGPPGMPANLEEAGKKILAQVRVAKTEVTLRARSESSATVDILNQTPGEVAVRAVAGADLPGLTLSLSKNRLQAAEQAVLTIRFTPQENQPAELPPLEVFIEAIPFNKVVPVKIRFE
jgi:hypothetical protein